MGAQRRFRRGTWLAGAALAWLSMASHGSPLWTDRSWLRDVQYRTEANLAAGQSLYAYQHPRLNLPAWHWGWQH